MAKIKKRNLFIVIGLIIALVLGAFISIFFNLRSTKIAANAPGTIGNTAGNLNNGGLFVESNGKVYFANSFDDGTLYVMNTDETDIKKISSSKVVSLLAGGDYLYYFQTGTSGNAGLGTIRTPKSFVRSKKDGTKQTTIVRETIITGQLVDDTLFLQGSDDNGSYLFSIGTDKSDRTEIVKRVLNPSGAYNGNIYYNETEGSHYLYSMSPSTGIATLVLEHNVWNPVIVDNYVYFMDLDNNYHLSRYNLSGGSVEILTSEKVQAFNVGNGFIYYQTMGENSGLNCMTIDGTWSILIANGEFTDISMTSSYVYFKNYFEPETTYHSIIGSGNYEIFTAANLAAIENQE